MLIFTYFQYCICLTKHVTFEIMKIHVSNFVLVSKGPIFIFSFYFLLFYLGFNESVAYELQSLWRQRSKKYTKRFFCITTANKTTTSSPHIAMLQLSPTLLPHPMLFSKKTSEETEPFI